MIKQLGVMLVAVIVSLVLGAGVMAASERDDLPFLVTTLSKTFLIKHVFPEKEVTLMLRVLSNTNTGNPEIKKNVLAAFEYHQMLVKTFQREGWKPCDPLGHIEDAGTVEMTFEHRSRGMGIKTFVYSCDASKVWNMMKYRGGSPQKYCDSVAQKALKCIHHKYQLDKY